MRFGCHVSVAGGFVRGTDYAQQIGAECIQIFAKSPRQWQAPPLDPAVAEQFRAAHESSGVGPVFTHTAYLLNLSGIDDVLREKSILALADELVRGGLLGAAGVVTHLGNDSAHDDAKAAKRAGRAIASAVARARESGSAARLLLENTAGSGSTFGATFAELSQVIDAADLDTAYVGCCLDTCHAHAAGMDVSSAAGWAATLNEMQRTVGVDRLGLIHANDCLYERGSKKDRHAWIGDGYIGVEGFRAMVCESRLQEVAVVTEMPGDVPLKDTVNLERLFALRDECTQVS